MGRLSDPDVSDALVNQMVTEIDPAWTVERVVRFATGTDFAARLTLSGRDAPRRAVLKATTGGLVAPPLARTEPVILRELAGDPLIPVPRLLGAVTTHADLPAPFFLMEWAHGQNREGAGRSIAAPSRRAIFRQSGRILATVHRRFTFDRFGSLGATDGSLHLLDSDEHPAFDDGGEWIRDGAEHALAALTDGGGYFPDLASVPGRFRAIVSPARQALATGIEAVTLPHQTTLCHTDFRYGNLLVDPPGRRITAVLDWANVIAGDPLYDLAFAEQMLLSPEADDDRATRSFRSALRTSYAAHRPDTRLDEGAEERMALYGFVWRLHAMACLPLWLADASESERERRADEHRAAVHAYADRW